MPSQLITTLFSLCVCFAVLVILLLAPPLIGMKLKMDAVAQDAARVYALTGSSAATQDEINADLTALNLPTTWNGQLLVSATIAGSGQPGVTFASTPTSANAQVVIHYNAPLAFDRALTLFGGPTLPATVPMTASASQWNELQYTGSGP